MLVGLILGIGTGLCALPLALVGWPARALVPGAPRRVRQVSARLVALDSRRLARFLNMEVADRCPPGRTLPYLTSRVGLAALSALVLASLLVSVLYGSLLVWGWVVFSPVATVPSGIGGAFLLFLTVQGVSGLAGFEVRLARRYLGPSEEETLRRRIAELSDSRAGVVEAISEERRRIERDLHDGVQQRLVALGMSISRAQRYPHRADELLNQARQEAAQALTELREVAWRVYPTVLDEAGLHAALETVAERSPLPVRLSYRLREAPSSAVGTVAYFVVCEAVTNAVKHSGAERVTIAVSERGDDAGGMAIRVTDDGRGGADPAGGGLLGLARRVAALDGHFEVDSPTGGPTVIAAELPCA